MVIALAVSAFLHKEQQLHNATFPWHMPIHLTPTAKDGEAFPLRKLASLLSPFFSLSMIWKEKTQFIRHENISMQSCLYILQTKKNCHPSSEANWPSNQHQKYLCIISKWDSFNKKKRIVSKPLRLVSAIMTLLEEHNTPLLSLYLEVGVTVIFPSVCI